ncbi:MAG: hypothetical protein HOD43_02440 [Candidatus Marinimicrobia bacterium]|nr:hypothetical protein [Candidatus Neomarinimicrobiota bacterium]MBT3630411.1 hypothetical protein [Candidatus Neomarinimicrobiota bacterium]MBT3823730.1 hypothetical protein [Candidatus Neomarinimicrobiota bacterium]MBT4131921.1 hypothetical protein [Candidatus Neomarinimicrobiota bacterium]MBT4294647.1 hypothetical protein [Candidatus Neomarinimicrobiota bacterium]
MDFKHNLSAELWALTKGRMTTVVLDVFILTALYTSVMFAHLLPIPLYQLDPMKLLLMGAIIYSSRGNAILMAVSLPIFSTLAVGHPIFPKNLIISIELIIFTGVITSLGFHRFGSSVQFLLAVLISKIAYYLLKAALISFGMLNASLFSTGMGMQMISVGILFSVFWLMKLQLTKKPAT